VERYYKLVVVHIIYCEMEEKENESERESEEKNEK
jgi:hypothetical protein